MLQAKEFFETLQQTHLRFSPLDQQILLRRGVGERSTVIARRLHRAERTVRDHVNRAQSLICSASGLDRADPVVLGAWVALHLSCDGGCLARGRHWANDSKVTSN